MIQDFFISIVVAIIGSVLVVGIAHADTPPQPSPNTNIDGAVLATIDGTATYEVNYGSDSCPLKTQTNYVVLILPETPYRVVYQVDNHWIQKTQYEVRLCFPDDQNLTDFVNNFWTRLNQLRTATNGIASPDQENQFYLQVIAGMSAPSPTTSFGVLPGKQITRIIIPEIFF